MRLFRSGNRQGDAAAESPASQAAGLNREKLDALLAVCRNNLTKVDEDLIARAFTFTWQAHREHRRKSGEPYFTHPYAVAMIVAQEIPLDDVSVAAALLHDVIEDCEDYTYEDIAAEFGATVADIVDGATKISTILKSKEITKAENYRKLMVSMVNDIRVILVKFADRLHNMRTLEFVGEAKQERIARETLEIYAPLAHRFGLGRLKWELEDLSFKFLHPEEFRQLKSQVSVKRRDREEYIARFCKPIRAELERAGLAHDISGRPKHLYSIYKKMTDRGKTFDEIYDLFAIRIILDTKEEKDCYLAYAVVCEVYTPIPERYKNYIALPKQNGYKSIHTTVLGPDGRMVEVQMRTREMHEIAEKGIAAHWAYKESLQHRASAFENWVRWVRDVLEAQSGDTGEEGARQLIEDFRRNLYQEEIVVFTPKGDLIVLPNGATPVDFAFEIHSEVGLHTIGAKVNGRIVPLNRRLHSGDQVEVITSRNQRLSPDWEQFVVTQKARVAIRRFINEQSKQIIADGREKWERKARKLKMQADEAALKQAAEELKFPNITRLMLALGRDEIGVDEIVRVLQQPAREKPPPPAPPVRDQHEVFEEFARAARGEQGVMLEGQVQDVEYEFARCCSPLPGDDIIGFVTLGRGIKVHRVICRNIQRLQGDTDPGGAGMRERLVQMGWPGAGGGEYLGGIRVEGEDRPGVLNEISAAVSSYENTNIRSVNIDTDQSHFRGSVLITVRSLDHLHRVIERLRKVKGVTLAERFVEMS
jgi:GTP diphosphokinase / guanosine-3',5'-bis(diphosphate) 3'-diphosphatase